VAVDGRGIPLGTVTAPANRHDSPLLGPTLDAARALGMVPEGTSVHLDRGYDSEPTRARLLERGLVAQISEKGRPAPLNATKRWVVERTLLLASEASPQEAPLVHGAARKGGGLLGGPLGRDRHRQAARPGGVDPLPLGRVAFSETLTYWWSLLLSAVGLLPGHARRDAFGHILGLLRGSIMSRPPCF
jgi:hypothetical protein